jgi:hypothetical protein
MRRSQTVSANCRLSCQIVGILRVRCAGVHDRRSSEQRRHARHQQSATVDCWRKEESTGKGPSSSVSSAAPPSLRRTRGDERPLINNFTTRSVNAVGAPFREHECARIECAVALVCRVCSVTTPDRGEQLIKRSQRHPRGGPTPFHQYSRIAVSKYQVRRIMMTSISRARAAGNAW